MKIKEELKNLLFWRDILCEFLITFILLAYHTGAGLKWTEDETVSLLRIGLCMGLLVFALIEGFGHISGAHMNPAVSLGFCISRDISIIRAIFYVIAQCAGGIAGAAVTYWLTPPSLRDGLGPVSPNPLVTSYQALIMETLLTLTLMIVIYGATDARHRNIFMPGLPIGMAVSVNIGLLGRYTGGSMNPALTLGPSVVTGKFIHHWVYWCGPFLGSILAALIYKYAFMLLQEKYGPEVKRDKLSKMDIELEKMLTEKQIEEADGLHCRKNNNV